MDDVLSMRLVECVCDLDGVAKRLAHGQCAPLKTLSQRFAFQVLHYEEVDIAVVRLRASNIEDRADVRMAQPR
jgi:hypothetical protein